MNAAKAIASFFIIFFLLISQYRAVVRSPPTRRFQPDNFFLNSSCSKVAFADFDSRQDFTHYPAHWHSQGTQVVQGRQERVVLVD